MHAHACSLIAAAGLSHAVRRTQSFALQAELHIVCCDMFPEYGALWDRCYTLLLCQLLQSAQALHARS